MQNKQNTTKLDDLPEHVTSSCMRPMRRGIHVDSKKFGSRETISKAPNFKYITLQ